ncbi:MAG TPA: hypothetical protein VKB75_13290 [Jatrophihabitans sp.]|nr:hypothetical protein [Jatrophihabitans sp.]
MRTGPFLLRRVFAGVLLGVVLVLIGFFSWVHYRSGQYHHREDLVLSSYRGAVATCVAAGNPASVCSARGYRACLADPFWLVGKPFSLDVPVPADEAGDRCRSSTGS